MNVTPGYYWILSQKDAEPSIARLTKNSGWFHFDGSHVKLVPSKPHTILQKVEYGETNDELDFLRWFWENCDFGPADDDVRTIMIDEYQDETKKKVPLGYDWRVEDGN